jgi:hypothetical protein
VVGDVLVGNRVRGVGAKSMLCWAGYVGHVEVVGGSE